MPEPTAGAASEQRATIRFDATMPVHIEGSAGSTQNISAQGVFFETELPQAPGELVSFVIEYRLYGRLHRLMCEGKVVRVEAQDDGRHGVAARLLAPFFEGEEIVAAAPPR